MLEFLTDLQVNAPLWKWILGGCIALGLALLRYAIGSDRSPKSWLNWGLGILRFMVLGTLCFLLLEPLIKSLTNEIETSKLILVHDGTSSQWMGKDSTAKKLELQAWVKTLPEYFEKQGVETESFVFGSQLKSISIDEELNFDSPRTDIAGAIEGVRDLYSHKNVAGVIFTTDGLTNRGHNPDYGSQFINAPYFFVGSGDTTNIKDLKVVDLICNSVAYLGNDFPAEVNLHARGFKGDKIKSSIYVNDDLRNEVVWSPELEVDSKNHKFNVRADNVGAMKIRVVSRSQDSNELLMSNNSLTTLIDILESKRRVLIVAEAPHPDVAALRLAITSNKHQEVEVVWSNELNQKGDLPEHDVVILHNLPNSQVPLPESVGEAIASDIPMLFIGGASVDWKQLPTERIGIVYERSDLSEAVGAGVNLDFKLFAVENSLPNKLSFLPPLNSAFGKIEAKNSLEVLLYKKLANLETTWPLWAFNKDAAGRRSGVILGDGIWRWRMESFIKDGDFKVFDDLVNNSIKYVASRDDIRRFRIESPSKLYEDERVKFTAQVYDASLKTTTDIDVELVISDKDGNEFNYSFNTEDTYYSLNCGRLSPGTYKWESQCVLDSEVKELKGEFNVVELKAEQTTSAADHGLLKRLSKKSGGLFLGTIENAQLKDVLENIQPIDIVHEYTERQELIRYDILVWLILGALTLEWVIRRRQGGY